MLNENLSQNKNILYILISGLVLFILGAWVYFYLSSPISPISEPSHVIDAENLAPAAPISDIEKVEILDNFVKIAPVGNELSDAEKMKLLESLR